VIDAFDLEVQGKPTITICHSTFERAARTHALTVGLPDLPLLIEPKHRRIGTRALASVSWGQADRVASCGRLLIG
jgi:hypothetical protein